MQYINLNGNLDILHKARDFFDLGVCNKSDTAIEINKSAALRNILVFIDIANCDIRSQLYCNIAGIWNLAGGKPILFGWKTLLMNVLLILQSIICTLKA